MKQLGLWIYFCALLPVWAQVTVEVTQTQDQFLPGEAVPVAVRITNLSGQTLHLGDDADWLTFSIESQEGSVVPKFSDVPVIGAFSIESSEVAIKRADLSRYFGLLQPDRYKITATIRIKQWAHEIASPPRGFDVIEGVKLWEQEFGVPKAASDPQGAPEIRRYILQQANYIRGQIRLYLRVTDFTGARPLRVVSVGGMISLSRPEHQVDSASNLHILYQNGPHAFSYSIFTPDGDLQTRQTYDYLSSRPRLQVIEEGKIVVAGGVRRIASSDVPPPKAITVPEGPKPVSSPAAE
jgi:hypothetical protein